MSDRNAPWHVRAKMICLGLLWCSGMFGQTRSANFATIPRTWDDTAISKLEVPLANPIGSPKHITADYYYRIPVRPIYKHYPVYAPAASPSDTWIGWRVGSR